MERSISYIHKNKLAVAGKKYYDKLGNVYVGLPNGRLQKFTETVQSTTQTVQNITNPLTGVQSVTGLDTDNTDSANPVVQIAVDGITITGDGTPGNPLVGAPTAIPDSLSPLLLMGG